MPRFWSHCPGVGSNWPCTFFTLPRWFTMWLWERLNDSVVSAVKEDLKLVWENKIVGWDHVGQGAIGKGFLETMFLLRSEQGITDVTGSAINLLRILLKHRFWIRCLGEGLRFCISSKFPGDASSDGLGATLNSQDLKACSWEPLQALGPPTRDWVMTTSTHTQPICPCPGLSFHNSGTLFK